MSKWGTQLIEGLVKEQQAKIDSEEQEQKKKKKDNAWKNDPVEYAKRIASAKKHCEKDPIIQSYMNKNDLFWIEDLSDEEKEKQLKEEVPDAN